MQRTHLAVAVAIVFAAGTVLVPPAPLGAGTPPESALSAFGTARIDGVLTAGEWSGAARIDLEAVLPAIDGGARVPAAICVMNDATTLYLGASLAAVLGCLYNPIFAFDNDDHGYLNEVGNDSVAAHVPRSANGAVDLLDQFTHPVGNVGLDTFTSAGYSPPGTIDESAAGGHPGGNTTWVEMSHPLDSADDLHDFSLSLGDGQPRGRGRGVSTWPRPGSWWPNPERSRR